MLRVFHFTSFNFFIYFVDLYSSLDLQVKRTHLLVPCLVAIGLDGDMGFLKRFFFPYFLCFALLLEN